MSDSDQSIDFKKFMNSWMSMDEVSSLPPLHTGLYKELSEEAANKKLNLIATPVSFSSDGKLRHASDSIINLYKKIDKESKTFTLTLTKKRTQRTPDNQSSDVTNQTNGYFNVSFTTLYERETMNANFDPIVKLARGKTAATEDAAFGLPDNNSAIAEALKDLLAEEEKNVVRAAAQEIVKVAKAAEVKRNQLVEQIRAARAAEARAKEQLNELKTAHEYANSTMNYLPLALVAGMNVPQTLVMTCRELFYVPPKPIVVAAATKPAKKTTSGK